MIVLSYFQVDPKQNRFSSYVESLEMNGAYTIYGGIQKRQSHFGPCPTFFAKGLFTLKSIQKILTRFQ